jgi:hypothetical protein
LTGVPEERPESQRAEPFDTPTPEEIIQISKMHVGAMESSDADEVWRPAGRAIAKRPLRSERP